MEIVQFTLGPIDTNCMLLHNGKEAIIIDVGGDAREVLAYLREHRLKLTDILVTHMHVDHVLGVADLAESTGAKVWANSRDEYLLTGNRVMGFPDPKPFKYENIEEGTGSFLGAECRMLSTPGHTPGSISYYFPDCSSLFCGDVLFYRSVGRTDFPGGDTDTLMNSIRQKIYSLPDDTAVYPGHMLATGVGDEKRLNPFVKG